MKEILKYLRQTNSLTQEDVANRLEISRQSYIKYENGEKLPSEQIIRKLSIIYDVTENFIKKNEIPQIEKSINKKAKYYISNENNSSQQVSDVNVSYASRLEGFFDGFSIRILNLPEGVKLQKGQKFSLFLNNEQEEIIKKEKAFNTFMSFKGSLPQDFDYKKELLDGLEEKFGSFN